MLLGEPSGREVKLSTPSRVNLARQLATGAIAPGELDPAAYAKASCGDCRGTGYMSRLVGRMNTIGPVFKPTVCNCVLRRVRSGRGARR
jgi:hypothetical protein